jgi:hypothetical protein
MHRPEKIHWKIAKQKKPILSFNKVSFLYIYMPASITCGNKNYYNYYYYYYYYCKDTAT